MKKSIITQLKYRLTIQNILIALIVISSVLSIYFRSVYREQPIMDERVYAYICTEEEGLDLWGDDKCTEKVQTISDAIYSQANHYKYINGRFIVHLIEQIFTGVWGIDALNIIDALIFGLLVVLIAIYTTEGHQRRNPLYWALISMSLLLFFPLAWRLWTSYNYAPNYLLPSMLTMAYLVSFKQLERHNFSTTKLVLFSLLAFVLGASHEAFSIPLSGAMVVYSLINIKTIFKRQALFPILALGIGTLILCVAPGNLNRVANTNSGGTLYPFCNDIDNMMHIKFMWIIIASLVIYSIINKAKAKQFLTENSILIWFFFWGIMLSFIANTGAYSLTAIELISLILIIKLIQRIQWLNNKRFTYPISTIILVVVTYIQCQAVIYGKIQMNDYNNAIQEYVSNNDGIFRKPNISKPFYVEPYVLDWKTAMADMCLTQNLQKDYNQLGKSPLPLIADEYDALANGSMFTERNAIPGGSGFYGVADGSGYWLPCDTLTQAKALKFHYKRVNFSTPGAGLCLSIKFALSPESYPSNESIDSIKTVNTRWGTYRFIAKPKLMEVDSITIDMRN